MVCEFDTHPHDGPCIPWAGKPALTCRNAGERTYESATMGTENRVLPAPLPTARELASPTEED